MDDNNSEILLNNKIQKLGLEDHKDKLSPQMIDILYDKYVIKRIPTAILEILNNLLQEMVYTKIIKIEEFKVVIADFKNINN